MKKITFIIFFITGVMFSACTDDSVSNQDLELEKVIVTYGVNSNPYATENGYRRRELIIDTTDVTFKLLDSFTDNSSFTLKDTISIERWANIKNSIDFNAFSQLDSIIVPTEPHVTMIWINIQHGEKSKKVVFNFLDESKFPAPLKKVLDAIMPVYGNFPQP